MSLSESVSTSELLSCTSMFPANTLDTKNIQYVFHNVEKNREADWFNKIIALSLSMNMRFYHAEFFHTASNGTF